MFHICVVDIIVATNGIVKNITKRCKQLRPFSNSIQGHEHTFPLTCFVKDGKTWVDNCVVDIIITALDKIKKYLGAVKAIFKKVNKETSNEPKL